MSTRIILVTVPNEDTGRSIALEVINAKLAACVNIVPALRSLYFWEGRIQDESESLMIIKSNKDKLPGLERKILELHPYSVPEFVVLESEYTAEGYLRWLSNYLS